MISAPPQPCLRLKIIVFLAAISLLLITSTLMFSSYIATAAENANYLTLGFGKVYVLSPRPSESQRLEMAKMLGFQGIPFGFFPATSASDLGHPQYWLGEDHWTVPSQNHTSPELLARFRTHTNVINDIVRLELKSALVLDDQADMELDIKQEMHALVQGALPDSWELVFLGRCGQQARAAEAARLLVAQAPVCTFAYAVSQLGARRLKRVLNNMWANPPIKPFDEALDDMVQPMFLEAYMVDPPLVSPVDASGSQAVAPSTLQRSTRAKMKSIGL
ncbi:hypothetical protein GGI25_004889 [Coemansia spiralis]|uniref:Uncharacterized protein n=2 Tax=Coemansia TaxID=4863 RepID=A0A9W8G5L2_9FUNG|nr:hypothetical protein BX070DRAFT_249320 [Coemansia spiralis]KAJ1990834.1 hypothetical protein EDC05_003814 [Coemansia umbellata]KAJ2622620.1 hypothetical protein GGI26_003066 [Coemansia sp. RSA 1358]KAJ2672908.1 hypothetical protein GGI25_004889 [Coemansia spiralis]